MKSGATDDFIESQEAKGVLPAVVYEELIQLYKRACHWRKVETKFRRSLDAGKVILSRKMGVSPNTWTCPSLVVIRGNNNTTVVGNASAIRTGRSPSPAPSNPNPTNDEDEKPTCSSASDTVDPNPNLQLHQQFPLPLALAVFSPPPQALPHFGRKVRGIRGIVG
ncbi:hypothetical protein BC832DRAFT_404185 [Gaertneriomyces semiglobifer]|nr:hypothetical protein BC832DRAFT_404185 [Gaertneriomyces semiglobifer]